MLIKEKELKPWIDNFYGYGSWSARFWFISLEEPGGDLPEDVAERINYFYKTHPTAQPTLCDVHELYSNVKFRADRLKANSFQTLYDYRFGNNAVLHGGWKNLIAFEHGYNNLELPDLLKYQQNVFALPSPHYEALIPLYPLPSPHNHAWYYSWLDLPQLGFIRSRQVYQDNVYESRMNTILNNISTYRPQVVLMYGMDNINKIKKSVEAFFCGPKFKMVKSIQRETPQYHRVDLEGTTMLITTQVPTLRHNRIETGFDWYEFGRKVKLEL